LDSYIIRVYRRGAESGKEIAGLVERVGNGKRLAFGSSKELWEFLTDRNPHRKAATKAKRQRSDMQK
jgi:hypothetical protein